MTSVSALRGRIEVATEVQAQHSCEEAWSVITDYNNLGAFMPNMSSRVLSENDSAVLVEQTARSSLVPLLGFQLTLEFIRETPEHLRFCQIQGSLRGFHGSWRVTQQPGGCHIYYHLHVKHGFPLPGPVLVPAVRADVERIMPAIVAELARRNAGRGGG